MCVRNDLATSPFSANVHSNCPTADTFIRCAQITHELRQIHVFVLYVSLIDFQTKMFNILNCKMSTTHIDKHADIV